MSIRPSLTTATLLIIRTNASRPFICIAKELMKSGHRVRIATHPSFETFVHGHDLEFYDIGGDPEELMSYVFHGSQPGTAAFIRGPSPWRCPEAEP